MKKLIMGCIICSIAIADLLTDIDATYRVPINTYEDKVTTTTDELSYIYKGKLKALDGIVINKIFIVDSLCDYQAEFVEDILLMSNTSFKTVVNTNNRIEAVRESDMMYKLMTTPNSIGITDVDHVVMIKDNGLVIIDIEE